MSLNWLLRIVTFFAVACAALARPTAPWLAATASLMFVCLSQLLFRQSAKKKGLDSQLDLH